MNGTCVIPQPLEVTPLHGVFRLNAKTPIEAGPGAEGAASYLHQLIAPAVGGLRKGMEEKDDKSRSGAILLTTWGAEKGLGEEGYAIMVTSDSVIIRASQEGGLFQAVQTLRQLLPPEIEGAERLSPRMWPIPAVAIRDKPRFRWRGLMLDVGRHFFPVQFIKRLIDLLALHKMNVFHWHLTEDQGWRMEIKRYRRLTEVGSRRKGSPLLTNRNELDGTPYEGFYTQDEIREVVQYAARRLITVVPEVEMPGHSMAALASYPHLGCTGGPYEVGRHWGIEEQVFCAGNEQVYEFLENVLDEVTQLFPGLFIHIGGDECPKQLWRQCPKCQALIGREKLKDESGLQSYFVKRVGKILEGRGRRPIGWDEILEGGLAPGASVMSWRGIEGGVRAALAGHDAVMCPTSYCYFNTYQAKERDKEPPASGGFIPLEKVYSYDPVPPELPADAQPHILGAQGNVWTEYIPDGHQVEYMAFPRACALAEVLWSGSHRPGFEDFGQRLGVHLSRLRKLGINYRDPFPFFP
jgi:hexosaminidase